MDIFHTLKSNRDKLEAEGKLCRSCGIEKMRASKTGVRRSATWSRVEVGEWKRQCSTCGKDIFHKSERGLMRAIQHDRKCDQCKRPTLTNEQRVHLSTVLTGRKCTGRSRGKQTGHSQFVKQCPKCQANMFYTRTDTLKKAIRMNTVCSKCSNYVYNRTWKQVITSKHTQQMAATKAGYESYQEYTVNRPAFNAYQFDVYRHTKTQNTASLYNADKIRGLNGVDGAHQLDHVLSIYEGFHKHIPAAVVGNIANLQIIPWEQNIAKKNKTVPSLTQWLSKQNISYIPHFVHSGSTSQQQLTAFLPDYHIAIWVIDTEKYHGFTMEGYSQYHAQTVQDAYARIGIHVMVVFDVEWLTKFRIITSKILHMTNRSPNPVYISGRKLEIQLIDGTSAAQFYDAYHIQGGCSAKYHIGAYYQMELVTVMSFSLPRISGERKIDGSYELVRFATKDPYIIRGAFSKLLTWFRTQYAPSCIFSFAHGRFSKSHQNVYETCGFQYESRSTPNYYYISPDGYQLKHKFAFAKKKLINDGFPAEMTETEIMKLRGYRRVWETGHHKFILNCGSMTV